MRLLIDLGNTRLKYAFEVAGETVSSGAFAYAEAPISASLKRLWQEAPAVTRAYAASVAAAEIEAEVERAVRDRFSIHVERVRSPAAALGIRNAYREPARLGVDRFLGLAALHAKHRRAQILIGVGTAMTLDALDPEGIHLGGWIVPSPALMRDSVLARTARVGAADGEIVDFAADTADALRSGSLYAALGVADRFCANAARRFGAWPAIVLTGGGAEEMAPFLAGAEREPDLVLRGLALWAEAAQASEFAPRSR